VPWVKIQYEAAVPNQSGFPQQWQRVFSEIVLLTLEQYASDARLFFNPFADVSATPASTLSTQIRVSVNIMTPPSNSPDQKLSRGALIALVVGSMIGSGIFALPSSFGRATGGLGALIAWGIAGVGMLMLAFVFQTLSRRKPDLDTGIYAYAKAGFGDYPGFASAVGYWIGCCLADVACLVLIKATLGQFFPIFGDGTTPTAIAAASALLWGVHFLILRGIKEAAALNTMATLAKIVPILLFIVVVIFAFKTGVFAQNFWGGEEPTFAKVSNQVRNTMLVTVFVFVGIEGASVYSRYAKSRDDVGIATVLGFVGVLTLLVLVTMLSYGILLRRELTALATPSMAGVLEAIVGPWGKIFISVGLLISVLGNYLSWSLLAAEVLHSAAVNRTMPSFLAHENAKKVPAGALWLTNIVIQAFLLVTYFAEYAFTLALKMTSSVTLIPYLLVAAYGLKLAWTGETYAADSRGRAIDWVRSAIATIYAAGMIYAGGAKFLLLSALLYAPGTALFVIARRERKKTAFTLVEGLLYGAILFAAAVGLYSLVTGTISI
jgi:arginine:ornithine antiporter / lysine permease